MSNLTNLLAQVPPVSAYLILSLALLIESNLVVGVFVPTLTMMLTAGALAHTGYLHLPIVIVVAAASVVAADLISYHTGRYLGGRIRTGRRASSSAWVRAEAIMARRGALAVFPARFIPLLRTLVPHLAGATQIPYRRVAPFSITAAGTWAGLEAGSGYLAAESLRRILSIGAPVVVVAVLLAVGATLLVVRRRRPRQQYVG